MFGHSPSPSVQGLPTRVPRNESSTAMSIVSQISQEPNKTGGISPLSITYDDDFRYRTVSCDFTRNHA